MSAAVTLGWATLCQEAGFTERVTVAQGLPALPCDPRPRNADVLNVGATRWGEGWASLLFTS